MRKNIFDILSEGFNIGVEIDRIWNLFGQNIIKYDMGFALESDYTTILSFVDKYTFKNWKFRCFTVSPYDMMATLRIEDIIREKIYEPFTNVIMVLEFIVNMINRCDYALEKHSHFFATDKYVLLEENIRNLIERFGYTLCNIENEEKLVIIEKNLAVISAAEISKKDIAAKIIQYNHYTLKGDVESKKGIILALAGDIEPQRSELKTIHSDTESNLFFLLNNLNLRHNNIKPGDKNYKEVVANMGQTELESWYDETYQLILLSKLLLDNNERNKKIKDLRNNL
jgi:hypothetical protein